MESLTDVLNLVTAALLWPVVAALALLLCGALLGTGGLMREAWDRRVDNKHLRPVVLAHRDPKGDAAGHGYLDLLAGTRGIQGVFARRVGAVGADSHTCRTALDQVELLVFDRLARHGFAARVGPMLGLMGTLIPLGPALVGLSRGELGDVASQLVVAFGTTVIGLCVGVLFYLHMNIRRSWYARDCSQLEAHCDWRARQEARP